METRQRAGVMERTTKPEKKTWPRRKPYAGKIESAFCVSWGDVANLALGHRWMCDAHVDGAKQIAAGRDTQSARLNKVAARHKRWRLPGEICRCKKSQREAVLWTDIQTRAPATPARERPAR